MKITTLSSLVLLGIILFVLGIPLSLAASSLLIWPIDPVLEDKQPATALWLESRDQKSVYVQIRVLKWQQVAGKDELLEQQDVVASPPMAEIKAGKKQLIRLIKHIHLAAGEERAFRILIDEIPRADDQSDSQNNGLGLKFQMRYSVPLFVQGANIWTHQDYQNPRDLNEATQPVLHYKVDSQGKQQRLIIKNTGRVHGRLAKVVFRAHGQVYEVTKGLLGYVLAGAEMVFIIPNVNYKGVLEAKVNDIPKPLIIEAH